MAELSDAEKAQMIAEANQRQANQVPPGEAPLNTPRIGPDMADASPAPLLAGGNVAAPVSPSSGGGENGDPGEWGPYNDYQIVNTGFGEYAVEKGKVLFFELAQQFQAKMGAFITVRLPRYRTPDQTREEALAEFVESQRKRPVRA